MNNFCKNIPRTNVSQPYRPDIDGLRAVAVLSVIAFHFFPTWLSGGFLGVDIFFVISGFLITKIIVGQMADQRFSLIDFYSRRAKRILPALIFILLATLVCGYALLLANEYENLGRHILHSSFFANNFLLMRESGYFDADSLLKPLNHLWSLAVEEQFYLIWPVLLGVVALKKKAAYSYLAS